MADYPNTQYNPPWAQQIVDQWKSGPPPQMRPGESVDDYRIRALNIQPLPGGPFTKANSGDLSWGPPSPNMGPANTMNPGDMGFGSGGMNTGAGMSPDPSAYQGNLPEGLRIPTGQSAAPTADNFDYNQRPTWWNEYEAGPPGSPDYVRNPSAYGQQGWLDRYKWLTENRDWAYAQHEQIGTQNSWYRNPGQVGHNDAYLKKLAQYVQSGADIPGYKTRAEVAQILNSWNVPVSSYAQESY